MFTYTYIHADMYVPSACVSRDYVVRTHVWEAMQALVRVQAHMLLARIAVEIRAADIAVELEQQ